MVDGKGNQEGMFEQEEKVYTPEAFSFSETRLMLAVWTEREESNRKQRL